MEWEVVVEPGAVLGEGPTWTGEELWWVDIEGQSIHHTDPTVRTDAITEVGADIGSVIPRHHGGFVAGMPDGVALFGDDGREQHRILIEADDAAARMNDAKCDPAGRLFTGTMTHGHRRSALYRVDADLTVTRVVSGVGISNGMGWSPSGNTMYYIDTPTGRVDRFDYDPVQGEAVDRRPLLQTSAGDGAPDGMTVDADGCIWVAFWGGWCVRRYDPQGRIVHTVDLPVAHVTSCAFGGADLDRLFVTTATSQLSPADRMAQPLAGALFEIDPHCRGLAATPFAG